MKSRLTSNQSGTLQRSNQNSEYSVKHLRWSFFCENSSRFQPVILDVRCLSGFWIYLYIILVFLQLHLKNRFFSMECLNKIARRKLCDVKRGSRFLITGYFIGAFRTKSNIYDGPLNGFYHLTIFEKSYIGGEWPSGLRCCIQNQKVSSSNPTRRSTKPWDPIPLRGCRWPWGRNK